MTKETYGNAFRSGEKNIDDLYKKLIQELVEQSKEEEKFQYVMKDIFEIMRNFGWTVDNEIRVDIGGVACSGIHQKEGSNPKWAKPYGTTTYQSDAFIVIKNATRNPVVKTQVLQLPEGEGKPIKIS